MVTKKNLVIGFAALLLMTVMNLYHVLGDYGFVDGSLCQNILAQGSSSGGGSSSSGGGSSSSSSSSGSSSSDKYPVIHFQENKEISESYLSIVDGIMQICARVTITCSITVESSESKLECSSGHSYQLCIPQVL